MNSFIQKINLTFFYQIMLSFLLICTVACSKDDRIDFGDKEFEIEDYTVETEDALSVASDLPAYVFPYEYKNFGAALVRRLNNQIATLDENSYGVASVVIHSSMIENFKNEAQKFSKWRDEVWTVCYDLIYKYQAKEIERPTLDDVLSKLPTFEW